MDYSFKTKDFKLVSQNNKQYTSLKIRKKIIEVSKAVKNNAIYTIKASNSIEFIIWYLAALTGNFKLIILPEYLDDTKMDSIAKKFKVNGIIKNVSFNADLDQMEWSINNLFIESNYMKNLKLLITTSGSLANPKFVMLSQKNILNNTQDIMKRLPISNKDKLITTLPLNYVYGLSLLNTHVYAGATVVLNDDSVMAKNFWNKLNIYKISTFGVVPTQFAALLKVNELLNNAESIKYITQAGGGITIEEIQNFLNLTKSKIPLYKMYGQTEATARISILDFKDLKNKIGSVGKPLDSLKVEIKKTKAEKVNQKNEVGDIIVKGDNVFLGYATNYKDLVRKIEKNRALNTGDMGYIDPDGYLYVLGRKDRTIKLDGFRINLDDLESELQRDFNVDLVEYHNNSIYLFCIKKLIDNDILQISKKYNISKSRLIFKKIDEIPLLENNKVNRKKIIEYI